MANVELTVIDGENISIEVGSAGLQGAVGPQGSPGLGVPAGGAVDQVLIKKSVADYDAEWGPIKGSMLSGDIQLTDANIAPNAGISDSKLATISGANKVLNSATTATPINAPYSIVSRDAFGNFVANRIDVQQLGLAGGFLGSDATFTGDLTVGQDLTVTGNLVVSGTTTLVQAQDAVVEDQKLVLAAAATPSDAFANTGGLQLKGTTDKFFLWYSATDSWTSSVNLAVESGKTFRIGNDNVITASGLSPNIKLSAANIPDSTIVNAMLAAGSVTNGTIATNAGIQLTKLASGILPSSITIATANIPSGTITSPIIASGAIVNANISDNAAIGLSKLATGVLPAGITISSGSVPSGLITSSMIADGTITDADISANAVISLSKLASGTLPSGIAVSATNIGPGSITGTMVASGTLSNANIAADAAIELTKLAAGALPSGITISSGNISAGSVTNASIAADAGIALSKLGTGTLPSGVVVSGGSVAFGIDSLSDVNTTSQAPASGQTLRWNGTEWAPASITLPQQTITNAPGSLNAGASSDYTISASNLFILLSFTANYPTWLRVYGTEAARTADSRTSPGGVLPQSGTGFYAELVTTSNNQTITLAPVATVQGTNGLAYVRVQNMDSVARSLILSLNILNLPAS